MKPVGGGNVTSTPVGKGKPSTDVNSVLSMKTTTSFMPSSLRSRKPVSKVKRKVRRSRFSRMVLPKTEGNTTTQSTAVDKNMFTTPCDDDYNPAEPNHYADYCEQRRSREDMKRREEEHRYVLQQQHNRTVSLIGRGRGRG